jgi:predicted secreted acid phosphatase
MNTLRSTILALVSMFVCTVLWAEPTNLQVDKDNLKQYVNSGQYMDEIQHATTQAQADLTNAIIANSKLQVPAKLALVLDIDETALTSYPDMVELNFGGTLADIQKREARGKEGAIAPTLQLYNFAKQHGVAVFFITGRPTWMQRATIRNLKNVGFNNWNGITFKSQKYQGQPAENYKTAMRKQLVNQGYVIATNVGDQESDLEGGFAQETYKLPNPFYYIP